MEIDTNRPDRAVLLIHAIKDLLQGLQPNEIYQVCANVIGDTLVEVSSGDRQIVLDQTHKFGEFLGNVVEAAIETGEIELKDMQLENEIEDAEECSPVEVEPDDGDK